MKENDLDFDIKTTIGALKNALNVNARTLRIYEQEGLLSPERSAGNRRCYGVNDIKKTKFILFLTRNLAVNLAGIKIITSI